MVKTLPFTAVQFVIGITILVFVLGLTYLLFYDDYDQLPLLKLVAFVGVAITGFVGLVAIAIGIYETWA